MAVTPSPDEFYAAGLLGEVGELASVLANLTRNPGDHMVVGSSLDPMQSGAWDVLPPILWDIERSAQWALMERDVGISHGVRVEAFVGMTRGATYVSRVLPQSGKLPQGFEVRTDDELVTMSGNVVLDVVYRHHTIESAGEMLLELAEKFLRFHKEYQQSRT
jgi:hypothetical protein